MHIQTKIVIQFVCLSPNISPLSEMPILTYNRANIVIIKNAVIYIRRNIFNLRDTEVVTLYNISSIKDNRRPQSLSKY